MTLYLGPILKWADKLNAFIVSRPTLKSWMDWHVEMQWRWKGLRMDDIINDEIDIVQEAITRLPDQEAFARTFRIRRAMQLQLTNSWLPESEWVTFETDTPYLYPYIREICKERDEKKSLSKLFTKRASFN